MKAASFLLGAEPSAAAADCSSISRSTNIGWQDSPSGHSASPSPLTGSATSAQSSSRLCTFSVSWRVGNVVKLSCTAGHARLKAASGCDNRLAAAHSIAPNASAPPG
ncbi:hypothetical protein GGER_16450 [Serratia rubidaea]